MSEGRARAPDVVVTSREFPLTLEPAREKHEKSRGPRNGPFGRSARTRTHKCLSLLRGHAGDPFPPGLLIRSCPFQVPESEARRLLSSPPRPFLRARSQEPALSSLPALPPAPSPSSASRARAPPARPKMFANAAPTPRAPSSSLHGRRPQPPPAVALPALDLHAWADGWSLSTAATTTSRAPSALDDAVSPTSLAPQAPAGRGFGAAGTRAGSVAPRLGGAPSPSSSSSPSYGQHAASPTKPASALEGFALDGDRAPAFSRREGASFPPFPPYPGSPFLY